MAVRIPHATSHLWYADGLAASTGWAWTFEVTVNIACKITALYMRKATGPSAQRVRVWTTAGTALYTGPAETTSFDGANWFRTAACDFDLAASTTYRLGVEFTSSSTSQAYAQTFASHSHTAEGITVSYNAHQHNGGSSGLFPNTGYTSNQALFDYELTLPGGAQTHQMML